MALGAERGNVLTLVFGEGLRIACAGVAIGLAGALALTRALSSFLFGVAASDLLTFVTVSAFLVAASIVAAFFPARRAARVDPMAALRHE